MKNQDVIRSFAWGKPAAAGNLRTDGCALVVQPEDRSAYV